MTFYTQNLHLTTLESFFDVPYFQCCIFISAKFSESVREGTYFIFELRTWEQSVFKSNKYHNALFLNVSLAEDFLLYTAYSILRSEARFRSV